MRACLIRRALAQVARRPLTWILLLAACVLLTQLGTRGIWDPDEGRYTNVALNMLDNGDWLVPRRNDAIAHWTKPPLVYWTVASSLALLGDTPFAARLPGALGWLANIWLCWAIARRLAPGTQDMAALAYATMLLPLGAAGWLTTDMLLAACMSLAMWAYVEARFAARTAHDRHWLLLAWAASGLGFLAKGTPALLPLLVMLCADLAPPARQASPLPRPPLFTLAGLAVFAAIVLPWYVVVTTRTPGLLAYLFGDEVVRRLVSPSFGRHGEWYGWAFVYVPTLLLGTLPWTPALWRWCRAVPGQVRGAAQGTAPGTAATGLLLIWIGVPLLLFCLARSRMPLYLLPLCLPLAIAVAMQRQREGRRFPGWHMLLPWAVLVVLLLHATAGWATHKDARPWAAAIVSRSPGPVGEVLFVEDMARYGLHLHLGRGTRITKLALGPLHARRFQPVYDRTLEDQLRPGRALRPGAVWITRRERWARVQARLDAAGFDTVVLGTPYRGRILFTVAAR